MAEILSPVPGLAWRAVTLDDADALARLHAACYQVDGGYLQVAEEYRTELGSRDDDLSRDGRVAVEGRLIKAIASPGT